jgi:ribosomal protein S25
MNNYKEIDLWAGCTIEQAFKILLDYKNKGELVYCNFNGVMLYSDKVDLDTLDDAYKQITGKTKIEYEKAQQEWRNDYDKKEKEFKQNIPILTKEWIEKGKKILTKDKWDYWAEIVPIRLNDLYYGMELGCCLDIVKILNNNETLKKAKNEINSQGHSGMSYSLVCQMIKEFCKRGEEFVQYVR